MDSANQRGFGIYLFAAIIVVAVVGGVLALRNSQDVATPSKGSTTEEVAKDSSQSNEANREPSSSSSMATSSEAQNAPATIPFTVKVYRKDTKEPIPGASIYRFTGGVTYYTEMYEREPYELAGTTDEDGVVSIQLPVYTLGDERGFIKASAPGYSTIFTYIRPAETRDSFSVYLESGVSIQGTVQNEDGEFLEGAEITTLITEKMGESKYTPITQMAQTATDESGRFTLDGAYLESPMTIVAQYPGYVPSSIRSQNLKETTEFALTLKKATGEIYGKVTQGDGTPAVGVKILTIAESVANMMHEQVLYARMTTTDQEGRYLISALPADEYGVQFLDESHPGYPSDGQLRERVTLTENERLELNAQYPKMNELSIRGRAIDQDTGKGIADAKIYAGSGHLKTIVGTSGISDQQGDFQITALKKEKDTRIEYWAEAPYGYLWVKDDFMPRIELVEDEEPFLEVKFQKAAYLPIRVVQSDGKTPVPNASIFPQWGNYSIRDQDTTGNGGMVELTMPIGVDVTLTAEHPTYGRSVQQVLVADAENVEELVIQLVGYAKVAGHVYDPDGNPMEGITVGPKGTSFIGSIRPWIKTESDGSFVIEKVQSGDIEMSVSLVRSGRGFQIPQKWFDYIIPPTQALSLKEGEVKEGLVFQFEDSLYFEGIVIDEDGEPIPDVSLRPYIHDGSHHIGYRKTDKKGEFRIPLADINIMIERLYVNHSSFQLDQELKNLTLANSPLTITLTKKTLREVRVVDESGRTVPHFAWRNLLSSDSFYPSSNTSTINNQGDGLIHLSSILNSEVVIEGVALNDNGIPTGLAGVGVYNFSTEQEKEWLLVLKPLGSISGKVVLEGSNEPLLKAKISINSTGRSRSEKSLFDPEPVYTEANGEFTLRDVVARKQHLEVELKGYVIKFEPYKHRLDPIEVLPRKETKDVILKMGPTDGLRVKVLGRDGQPYEGAKVELNRRISSNAKGIEHTDEDGYASFEGIYQVSNIVEVEITAPEQMNYSERLHLDLNRQHEITIDFSDIVILHGTITVGGKPFDGTREIELSSSNKWNRRISIPSNNETTGEYQVALKVGEYEASTSVTDTFNRVPISELLETFTIKKNPLRQEKNFDLPATVEKVSVGLVFPEPDDFVPGEASLAPTKFTNMLGGGAVTSVITMTRADGFFIDIPAGVYTASFQSTDGEWHGTSEPYVIEPDGENAILVDIYAKAERIKIGEWNFYGTDQFETEDLNITGSITKSGNWVIEFERTEQGPLNIKMVALLVNGVEVSRDEHNGYASSPGQSRNPLYRLSAPQLNEGDRVSLRYTIKGNSRNGMTEGILWAQPVP